jgi:superfamily II DNA or RNA helicase
MFPEHCFLILCKRVSHAKKLEKMLTDIDIDVTSLVGVKRSFDTNARVLVATVQKAGVGFDHPKLNALMIAADVEQYFIQYLGRVFRTEHGSPLIFDFVDDFRTLKKHFSSRSAVYRKHGGTIKNFYKAFGKIELK